MPSAGIATLDSRNTRPSSSLPLRGIFSQMAITTMMMMLPSASSSPGITPAKNRRMIEVSVTMP
jgi:hypothetical protein